MKARWMRVILGSVLACFSTADLMRADPLDRWTWLYPRPQGNALNAVTYGNGLFVAVGDRGTIIASADGHHWINQFLGQTNKLLGVGYAAGIYVATGAGGTILTSSNGVDWTQRSSPTTNVLRAVAGNPLFPTSGTARFMAIGDNGTAVISSDSVVWSMQNASTTNKLGGVMCNNSGTFIVVGDNGTVLTCNTNWVIQNEGTTNHFQAIASDNVRFVAGGHHGCPFYQGCPTAGGVLLYSKNLFNLFDWMDTGAVPWWPMQAFTVSGLAFGGGRFVAVGYTAFTLEYNYPGMVIFSDNGTAWTGLPSRTSENFLYGVTYGDGKFVAVGAAGSILVSSNGLDWAEITGYHRTAITALACSEALAIASGEGAHRVYQDLRFNDFTTFASSNGADWVGSTTNLPAMSDLVASGGLFIGISGSCVFNTTNGFDWMSNCLASPSLHGIGYGNGLFFAVGDGGTIYTSTNGSSWSNRSVGTTGSFYCATYGNGLYVAAGTTVATSSDGTSWSLSPMIPPLRLTRIVYANRIFVAAADSGQPYYSSGSLLSSQDGVNWQVRYSPLGYAPGVACGNGTFVAISSGGTIIKSADGTNWTSSATVLPLFESGWYPYYPYRFSPVLCARCGSFIAGGYDGILMQSGDTRVPIVAGSARMTESGFGFSLNPQIGEPYRIQSSTNLEFWVNIYTAVASEQPTSFIGSISTVSPQRFFRVVSP